MTDIEKKVELKKLAEEIDKRCGFFRILTDMGINNPKPKKQNNGKLPGKG